MQSVKDQREKQSWSPTLSREAHGDVLIRSDLPSMFRGLFLPLLCALGDWLDMVCAVLASL